MPNGFASGSTSLFASPAEQQAARQQLDHLNQERTKDSGHRSIGHQAEAELKQLLNPEDMTEMSTSPPFHMQILLTIGVANSKPQPKPTQDHLAVLRAEMAA